MKREDFKLLIESTFPNKNERRQLTKCLRYILTGQNVGPDLYAICEVLGENEVDRRIYATLKRVYENQNALSDGQETTNCLRKEKRVCDNEFS
jgi:hypothetical protein